MSSVARIVIAVPSNLTCLVYEVVAVLITLVTIDILIVVPSAVLVRINPDIGLQIVVLDIDTLVEYRNNNRAVARCLLPRINNLNIGTYYRLATKFSHCSVVLDIPLLCIQRIVECALQRTSRSRHLCVSLLRQWGCLLGIGALDCAVYINLLHLAELREATRNLLCGIFVAITHDIPAVQAVAHGTLLVTLINREDTRNLEAADNIEQLIYTAYATTGNGRTNSSRLLEQLRNLGRELYENLACDVRLLDYRSVLDIHALLANARGERKSRTQYKC